MITRDDGEQQQPCRLIRTRYRTTSSARCQRPRPASGVMIAAPTNTGQESARSAPPDPIAPEVRRYLDDLVPDRPAELARMEEHARSSPAATRRERNARDAGCGDRGPDFVRAAVRRNVESGGYLHIGHVKAICVNFGVAAEFGGSSCP